MQDLKAMNVPRRCLNAPFGAPCFLTLVLLCARDADLKVLMHLLALGAL